ncbi:MAG: divalent metal cation transporter, partial [Planctomycetales bacterium]|nr:divalent metal cation transporter [Planctomycetales bacterium]
GWDKPFRGLARFDLATGMAIPFVVVTSCVVIASAFAFHGKVDEAFLSSDPQIMQTSDVYAGAEDVLAARVQKQLGLEAWASGTSEQRSLWQAELSEAEQNLSAAEREARIAAARGLAAWEQLSPGDRQQQMAALPEVEKRLAGTLVKRNAFQLAQTLTPLLGATRANWIFGLGVLGMGFSSIIILMLINGYVYRELAPPQYATAAHILGCVVAGICGALWPLIWTGESRFWLAILTSTFGMMLLPIAYITFFFMMNSRALLGDSKPRGLSLVVWNTLMGLSVAGALVAASSAIMQKMNDPVAGPTVLGIAVFFGLLVLVGFAATPHRKRELPSER